MKTKGFSDSSARLDHFKKHGGELLSRSDGDYERQADRFLGGSQRPSQHQCKRTKGDLVRFDCTTDEFGVLSVAGYIRTYFRMNLSVHNDPRNIRYFLDACKK